MRRRGVPRFASFIFCLVVVLAVGAVAWGAARGKSAGHGMGSAKDQAAAQTALLTGLTLPPGLVRDSTFTACGNVSDACLTGASSVAATLTALTSVVHAAGGSLPGACTATINGSASSANVPKFTCAVQGELKGAQVIFLLGDGWLLPPVPPVPGVPGVPGAPGHPSPRTAVLATVVTTKAPATHTATAGSAVDAAALLPTTWVKAPQVCAGGSTPPAPSPASSAPASPAATPAPSALTTSPPLPACTVNAITVNVGVHLALNAAAAQLSELALSEGFRLDGHPCIPGATPTSCGVWGERIRSGVQELFVATLIDDGRGDTTGTLAVTQQSQASVQS
jgi:hypothetical protein